jgi:electron transport complex protein RnfB
MTQQDQIYVKLREEIDARMPLGMPASPTGADVNFLRQVFTPEEARIAIHLSALPEPVKTIYKRVTKAGINITPENLEKLLDNIFKKGGIMGGKMFPKPKHYSLANFVVGMYEFQVDHQTKTIAQAVDDYMPSYYVEYLRNPPYQIRTIPIEKSLTPERSVATYDDIRAIVQRAQEPVAIIDCVCKQRKDVLHHPCKLSDMRNNCVMFGNVAESFLEKGVPSAKRVSKSELMDLLDKFEKIGFVLQPENAQDPKFMCVCCGCCCDMLTGLKLLQRPADFFVSNYYAQANAELCKGCETCVKRCQMQAIKKVDNKAVVNLDRCIGCGNCVATCASKAMSLIKKSKELVPPKGHMDLYTKIIMKKRGFLGTMKMGLNIMLGKKI